MPANRRIRMPGSESASIQHDELHHFRQLRETMPGGQTRHIVFADQEEEFGGRFALAQYFDCLHCVGWRRPFQLHRVETEKRLAFDRGAQHLQANGRRGWFSLEFVRRDRGRDEDHCFELQLFERVEGKDQMTVMDRIECPAKDADFFQTILFVATACGPCLFPAANMKLTLTL